MLVQEAKVQKDNFDTITAAIKPVLDCVDIELAPHPDSRQGRTSKISTVTPF